MRPLFLFMFSVLFSLSSRSQAMQDTTLTPCPVYITDTVSVNNFFIEGLPARLRVYRVRGDLTIQIEQREQFFTIFFHTRKLKSKVYEIDDGSRGRKEVEAAYSFKSGGQVSLITVSTGKMEVSFDKARDMWRIKLNGLIKNNVEGYTTYYKVRSEFYIR